MPREKFIVVLAVVVTAMATSGVASAAGTARRSGLSERQIKRIALRAARQAGDRHPILIQHAAGRRSEANKIASGDIVPDSTWCYLVAIRGRFVLNNVSSPPEAKPPTGAVMTLVVNARTGATLDYGVSNDYPNLKKLGPVTTDLGG
jgi:hypothetical protein